MNTSQIPFLLAFHRAMRLTKPRFQTLKTYFKSDFEKAWKAKEKDILSCGLDHRGAAKCIKHRSDINPKKELQQLQSAGATALILGEADYPPSLQHIYDPPALLFTRGEAKDEDFPNLAVVGSRKLTAYGKRAMEHLLPATVHAGITITSGLAFGTDFLAHKIAVQEGGRTLAVLGNGIDVIYPAKHRSWTEKQLEAGKLVIISEQLPHTTLIPEHFPIRNRLISGLAKALVVIEGTLKSGSLITARLANEHNKDVFTLPGDIFSPQSQGPNSLIQEGLAHPLTSPQQLLEYLGLEAQAQAKKAQKEIPRVGIEVNILECFTEAQSLHIDEIKRLSGIPAHNLGSTLILLEMKGLIKNLGNNQYVKNV